MFARSGLKCHGVCTSKNSKKIEAVFFGKLDKNEHGKVLLVLREDAKIAVN